MLILFVSKYKLSFKYKNYNIFLKYYYYKHNHQNKRRQRVTIIFLGLTEHIKSLVNLGSEISEKEPIMKLQVQLYKEQQLCVWNTSFELGFMIAMCNGFLRHYFIILLQFHFYRLSYTVYELIFTLNLLAISPQYLRNCLFIWELGLKQQRGKWYKDGKNLLSRLTANEQKIDLYTS